MRSNQLEFLIAIKNLGSINKASKQLFTSPQNISKAIKQLEDEWHMPLIKCVKQGTVLTEAGAEAANMAQMILSQIDEFVERYAQAPSEKRRNDALEGTVAIASVRMTNMAFLGELILKFRQDYPKVKITLMESDIMKIIQLVSEDPCYVGLGPYMSLSALPERLQPNLQQCEIIPLVKDTMVILVAKQSPLGKQMNISWANIGQQNMALYAHSGEGEDSFGRQFLEERLGKCDIPMVVSTSDLYYRAIAMGSYAGLTSARTYQQIEGYYKERIHAIKIQERAEFEHVLIVNKQNAGPICTQKFIAYLKKTCLLGGE